MDKITQPLQLSLTFDDSVELGAAPTPQAVIEKSTSSVAVIYDFKSAMAKREESSKAIIYQQILDSVRHIG